MVEVFVVHLNPGAWSKVCSTLGYSKIHCLQDRRTVGCRLFRLLLSNTFCSRPETAFAACEDPIELHSLLPEVAKSQLALLAVAGAPPLAATIHETSAQEGLLLVGPEGDFTKEEISDLVAAGAKPVGLGCRRLRVETAAVCHACHSYVHVGPHSSIATTGLLRSPTSPQRRKADPSQVSEEELSTC